MNTIGPEVVFVYAGSMIYLSYRYYIYIHFLLIYLFVLDGIWGKILEKCYTNSI